MIQRRRPNVQAWLVVGAMCAPGTAWSAAAQESPPAHPPGMGVPPAPAETTSPDTARERFEAAYEEAKRLRGSGDYDGALRMFDECERLAADLGDELREARAWVEASKAQTLDRLGRFDEADAALARAIAIAEPMGDTITLARLHLNRAIALDRRGRAGDGDGSAREAIDVLERIDPAARSTEWDLHRSRADVVMSHAAYLMGDVIEAQANADRAIERFDRLAPRLTEPGAQREAAVEAARAHNNRGLCLVEQARRSEAGRERNELLAAARASLEAGRALREQHRAPATDLARSVSNLGQAAALAGDIPAAAAAFERAWELVQLWPRGFTERITVLANRASLVEFDQPAQAIELYARAHEESQDGSPSSRLMVATRFAALLRGSGGSGAPGPAGGRDSQFELAEQLLVEAVELSRWVREEVGGDLLSQAQRSTFDRLGEPFEALAVLRIEQGRPAEALALCEEGRGRALAAMIRSAQAEAGTETAGAAAARREADAAYEQLEFARSKRMAALAARAAGRGAASDEELAALQRGIEQAEATYKQALREWHRLLPREESDESAGDAASIRATLPAGSAALVYAWRPEGVGAVFVPSRAEEPVEAHPVAVGPVAVHELAALIDDARRVMAEMRRQPEEELRRLAARLLPPVLARRMHGERSVVLVAAGPLTTIPVDVLPLAAGDHAGSRWIEDGPDLITAPSLRVLAMLGERAPVETVHPTMLVVGDPAYGADLPRLPATADEARALAQLVTATGGHAAVLTGESAALSRLRDAVAAGRWRWLHLATHGTLGSALRPGDARLELAAAGEPAAAPALTLQELLGQWRGRLEGTELVVLSACDTQRGPTYSGEGVISLPVGFFSAGARGVIATLWKVDDTATMLLMRRFYANRLGAFDSPRAVRGESFAPGEAMPAPTALREAKLWLRTLTRDAPELLSAATGTGERGVERRADPAPPASDPEHPYASPYYWAAFVFIGDSG